ncbi:MAG: hypothetical protein HRU19_30380 [Pseudobacteriovorax sp.]|nr:hypothetical protein [Pseudobacteriovorax sp.]
MDTSHIIPIIFLLLFLFGFVFDRIRRAKISETLSEMDGDVLTFKHTGHFFKLSGHTEIMRNGHHIANVWFGGLNDTEYTLCPELKERFTVRQENARYSSPGGSTEIFHPVFKPPFASLLLKSGRKILVKGKYTEFLVDLLEEQSPVGLLELQSWDNSKGKIPRSLNDHEVILLVEVARHIKREASSGD